MANKRTFLAVMLATTLAWSASAAFATSRPTTRRATTSPAVSLADTELNVSRATALPFGNYFLNAYRLLHGFKPVVLPVRGTGYGIDGINDGPDGTDPLGVKGRGLPSDGPAPANSPVH